MKNLYVADLAQQESQAVTSFFLVHDKQQRSGRDGKPFLALRLGDRTGVVEARVWDEVETQPAFERNDIIKVEAVVETYRGRPQLKVKRLRRAQEAEIDLADYLAQTTEDVEALWAELLQTARGLTNLHLRALLLAVLEDPELGPRLQQAPGAKTLHHAYRGGLLEHIVSLCRLCRGAAGNYAEIDLDLLLAGAILHDLGKVYELSYERALDYTTEGNLLGHITIALELLHRKMDALPGFPGDLKMLVQHMLLSHHGRLEFGSPITPRFPEAVLLHYLDDIDSKMAAMRSSLHTAEEENRAGDWTDWNRSLERFLLRKDKFLGAQSPAAEPPGSGPDSGEPDSGGPASLFDSPKEK